MGHHIINGKFKSDKYSWCLEGFFPLKFTDSKARKFIRAYAEETDDNELAQDLIKVCLDVDFEERVESMKAEFIHRYGEILNDEQELEALKDKNSKISRIVDTMCRVMIGANG